MATPIEIVGLVHIGVTSACSLIQGIKSRTTCIRSLAPLLHEAQELASNIQECVTGLQEFAGIPNLEVGFFSRALKKIQKVERNLHDLKSDIVNRRRVTQIFCAEKLTERVLEINGALQDLLRDLTVVGMLGEAVKSLISVSERRICYLLNRVLSVQADQNSAIQVIASGRKELEFGKFGTGHPISNLLASEQNAVVCFSIGKTLFEGSAAIAQDFYRAARYLQYAYHHGQREAAYYLGNMSYEGKGMEQCFQAAFRYFRFGAENGDANSLAMVAQCYCYGHGTKLNLQRSQEYDRLAAEAGSPMGIRNRAYTLLYGTGGNQNWAQAKRLLERARVRGYFRANIELAKCYEHGITVERDEKVAFELLKEAYEEKVPTSVSHLARCYEEGIGTQQYLIKAAELHRERATKRTYVGKQKRAYYGLCLVLGRGVRQNVALGMRLIQQGLLDYDATGWFVLGKCYQNGYGVDLDIAKAIMCFGRGAAVTNSTREIMECNMALAEMYESGSGLEKNMKKAILHYNSAATRIHVVAQWKMGLFYEVGEHQIEQNIHRAFDFFDKAARGGHTRAIRKAGFYYMKGIGVPRDRSHGKRLLREAVERGDDTAVRILRSERVWRLFSFRVAGLRRHSV